MAEIIGWGSALILLPAFGLQTYRQWKNRHEPGNNAALWFFILVLLGTGGQVAYSWMVRNWVYFALNSALVVNNGVGLGIAIGRKRADGSAGAHDSHMENPPGSEASVATPSTSVPGSTTQAGPTGRGTMNQDDRDEHEGSVRHDADPSVHDFPPEVVATTDPVFIDQGPDEGHRPRPDETVVAETHRVEGIEPAYVPPAVVPVRPSATSDRPSPRDGDRPVDRDARREPARAAGINWLTLGVAAVVALACGLGGGFAASRLQSTEKQDQSREQVKKEETKEVGEIQKAKQDQDATVGLVDTLNKRIDHLASALDGVQQKLNEVAVRKETTPSDVEAVRIKLGEIAKVVDGLNPVAAEVAKMGSRLDRLEGEIRAVDQRDRKQPNTATAAANNEDRRAEATVPADPSLPDAAMAEAIALFNAKDYAKADEIFRKLQATRSQDARVWYYSALSHGFRTGDWAGDARQWAIEGTKHEAAGPLTPAQVDAAFQGLTKAQGKEWLDAYRSQMVKR